MLDQSKVWICTNEEYHASLIEDSHSSLDLFSKSIEQYAARRVFRSIASPVPTEAMIFGSLFHTMVLEPGQFDREYIVAEKHDGRTKVGKIGKADFFERANGRTIVEQEDVDMAERMRIGTTRNSFADTLLTQNGKPEFTIRCCHQSGVKIKVRMDRLVQDSGEKFFIADLKTTEDVSPSAWSRTVHNFGYHRQAALYLDCCKLCGLDISGFIFIACSKTPPHECVCYELEQPAIELGRRENELIMHELERRRQYNDWSGRWSSKINKINLPGYAFRTQ